MIRLLIDRALDNYVGEPRIGLENRTLARLRARDKNPFFRWQWMTIGAVAAAALLVASVTTFHIRRTYQTIGQAPPAVQQTAYNSVPSNGKAEVHAPASSGRQPALASSAMVERPVDRNKLQRSPAQFPTPAPLSEQERLLVRLAEVAQKHFGTLPQQQPSAEVNPPSLADAIVIKRLDIAPLEPPAEAPDDNGPQR